MRQTSVRSKLYVKVSWLFNFFVRPRSENFDTARREFVLNVILLGVIFATGIALVQNIQDFLYHTQVDGALHPYVIFGLMFFLTVLLFLSRSGKPKFVAGILISVLIIIPFYTSIKWGIGAPAALLAYSLIIVMSGILISSGFTFVITGLICLINIYLAFLQTNQIIRPDYSWRKAVDNLGDVSLYVVIFGVIAVISWLYNRQSEIAFKKAAELEQALIRERDSLEQKVEERTREIKQARMEKLASLNRMAEVGRLTAGFFHDLVDPLNLVSLNLEELSTHSKIQNTQSLTENKVMLDRAINGTKRMLDFVNSARRQIRDKQVYTPFDLVRESSDVIALLLQKAKSAHVSIRFMPKKRIMVTGNPLRFSQVLSNLISNAIASYEIIVDKKNRTVEVDMIKNRRQATITVRDHGIGIPKETMPNIFVPFFTTKNGDKDIGIGLSICKDIVEREFHGTIHVKSKESTGTVFTIVLPLKRQSTQI